MSTIKIVSVGNRSKSIVKEVYLKGSRSVDFLFIEPDKNPSQPFSSFKQKIREKFVGADLILLVTTLGGVAGLHLSWKLVRLSKELGIFVIPIVSIPVLFESKTIYNSAKKAFRKLLTYTDTVILFDENLILQLPDKYMQKFTDINTPFYYAIRGLIELLRCADYGNVKREKILNWLKENFKGFIRVGYGIAEDESEVSLAINEALNFPFLENFPISSADFIVLNLTINYRNVEQERIIFIKDELLKNASEKAKILWGVVFDEEMEEYLIITLFVGKKSKNLSFYKN